MKKLFKITQAVLFICLLLLGTSACGKDDNSPTLQSKNLMRTISQKQSDATELSPGFISSVYDFSADLFKSVASMKIKQGENALISPISAFASMSLVASGAEGDTEKAIGEMLYPDTNFEGFAKLCTSLTSSITNSGKTKAGILSSMWINNNVNSSVKEDFLKNNAKYFNADIYKTDFTADYAIEDMNEWLKFRSDNTLTDTKAEISEKGVVYLINAVKFDGEWDANFSPKDVVAKNFENYNGEVVPANFIIFKDVKYISDSYCTGFSKKYDGGKYSFIALTPNEHISINDYISVLSGEVIGGFIQSENESDKTAVAQMPAFSSGFAQTLKPYLAELGYEKIFDKQTADFTKIMREQETTYISDIFQIASFGIERPTSNNSNTQTAVSNTTGQTVEQSVDSEMLVFNRPFVYAVVDNTTNLPVFLGTVLNINQ